MSNRLTVVIASIAGAFCVYCAQNAMNSMDHDAGVIADGPGGTPHDGAAPHDGFVADARGQTGGGTCCTQPGQTFTKLKEGDITSPSGTPVTVDVSAYREIVVYTANYGCLVYAFMPSASATFPTNGDTFGSAAQRLQVNGPTLALVYGCGGTGTDHYVVSGVN